MTSERHLAQQTQEKFQFYVIGVSFTVLALAVQTATFDGQVLAKLLELFAWASLLAAGLIGLSRIESEPLQRVKLDLREECENSLVYLRQQEAAGVTIVQSANGERQRSIAERISEYTTYIEALNEQIETLDRKAESRYRLFKVAFVVGICALVAARAYNPVFEMLC